MNDQEFDQMVALWNEPDPEEQAHFERLARKARQQGRLLAYADLAWFVLLVGGSAFAALLAPGPVTMAAAVLLLIATVWLTWRRRKYRQMARTLDTTDRASFLQSSVRNARANLRRVTLSIIAFPLLVPLAKFLKLSFVTGGDISEMPGILSEWAQSLRGSLTIVVLTLVLAYMVRSRLRIKMELRRLEELRLAEAEGARQDAEDAS